MWGALRNLEINGTPAHSPNFVDSTYVSAASNSDSSGKSITSGNTTPQIIQPDVRTKNGVFHAIDRVLPSPEVNEDAVDDAYQPAAVLAGIAQPGQVDLSVSLRGIGRGCWR